MNVTNEEFLTALFKEDAPFTHVTDFVYDPTNVPTNHHLIAWAGDYYFRYKMHKNSNQYFTISHFYADEDGNARRRKALYRHTRVIVLDDVNEKLNKVDVEKLPTPSWVLETSPGSEQWGYILNEPCINRAIIENLLDGLVANGLAPDGKDPGMKGVTRYVRLPEGYNTKASKMIGGVAFKCRLVVWSPFNTTTVEELAAPFNVDLYALRRDNRVDGAKDIPDHPLLKLIKIKGARGGGRYDITCPWVSEHTNHEDSGTGVFTNDDGSIGFKCHHGVCQNRTGKNLLDYLEIKHPGFRERLNLWQSLRMFEPIAKPLVSFINPSEPSTDDIIKGLMLELRKERPTTTKAKEIASGVLKIINNMPEIDKKSWHDEVMDLMQWSKQDFKTIIKDLKKQWYEGVETEKDFFKSILFVKDLNQFYDFKRRIFFTADGFQNAYSHEDHEVRKTALQDSRVTKVDRLDYAPKAESVFTIGRITYGNTWVESDERPGVVGDASRWFEHFNVLGWGTEAKHIMQWMAFTLLHPEQKINHMLLLGSSEGGGKDFLLYPLHVAMGHNCEVISGEELLSGFNDYLLSTKYLHVNEAELGDRYEAMAVSNKLKPIAAAPPDSLRVNQKNVKPIKIRNIVNASMTTNSQMPLKLNGPSRRFFAVWSDINTRDDNDNMTPEWQAYWEDRWSWMKGGGVEQCIYHLRHNVDLSDFNPAAAPVMTQFLREIRDGSKSNFELTVEAFIDGRVGAFHSDIITAEDASITLRSAEIVAPGLLYVEKARWFTPDKVGKTLGQSTKHVRRRHNKEDGAITLWIIRNHNDYRFYSAAELYTEYERQIDIACKRPHLKLVK